MGVTFDFTKVSSAEALDYMKRRVPMPSAHWSDLESGMHAKGFVVAGAVKSEMVCDFHGAITRAVEEGRTLADFRKDFDSIVAKHGWSYRGKRGWRTATIYNTNMRMANNAASWKRMTDPDVMKARPYVMYIGGLSSHPRKEHLAWNGIVLPLTDPWWDTHWPINAYGCKCKTRSLSLREMERDGIKPSKRPVDKTYKWKHPATGRVHEIPEGIDPGFDHNPGKSSWGAPQARDAAAKFESPQWKDMDAWGPDMYGREERVPADKPKASLGEMVKNPSELRASLERAIGGKEAFYKNPAGQTVCVNQGLVEHILEKPSTRTDGREAYFPFIRELIEEPYEVWVNFARNEVTGEVAIRQRYVKVLALGKEKPIGLVAETHNGMWMAMTFFRGGTSGLRNLRKGRLIWGRK